MSESRTDFWFPAKRVGWGWGPPVKWQGWLTIVIYLALVGSGLWFYLSRHDRLGMYICLAVLTSLLIAVMYLKGEPPGGSK
jgi:hypothetical protein